MTSKPHLTFEELEFHTLELKNHRLQWLFENETGIILTWKMVLKFCSKIFFAHDLVLYDKTLNWGLYYHHDEKYHFGKNRIYNSSIESQKLLDDAKLINEWKRKLDTKREN